MNVYVLWKCEWADVKERIELYENKNDAKKEMDNKVNFQLSIDDGLEVYYYENGFRAVIFNKDQDIIEPVITYYIEQRHVISNSEKA